MLSFLRARTTRSSPPRSPLCDAQWDGRALTLRLDAALAGTRVALDLDGSFFADAPVDTSGKAQFGFAFAPKAGPHANVSLRRGRDGAPLADAPFAIRFGEPGMHAVADAHESVDTLGDIGRVVPFGVDCAAHDVAIVVPVYNAPTLVERCLESVLRHTTGRAKLIVLDDASDDPLVAPLLARYADRPQVRVLRNERNRGFTATANRGIAEAGRADVVLLNADTEVGPSWLTGLRRAALGADDTATVTAVSDHAGAFSVPELEEENGWPERWSFAQAARSLWHYAGLAYPELPTGNGFCMYIRRGAIDAVGALDEAAFPEGYGEENDFCQRASARGLRHRIAGNVYVRHARSSSFGHERRAALGARGMAVLRERWPGYEADVGASLFSFERRVLDWRVRRVFASAGDVSPRMRVLCASAATSRAHDLCRLATPADDAFYWTWLQASAVEAVVDDGTLPVSIAKFAAALGIPFACARQDDIDSTVVAALAAARSFVETAR